MPKIIISISGKKGVGKDTCANIMMNYILENYPLLKIKKFSFAYPLKMFISKQWGFSLETIEEQKNKDFKVVGNKTMRELLQDTGMSLREVFGEDIFVNYIKEEINKSNYDIVVIPDLRFKNEYMSLLNDYPDYEYYAIKIKRVLQNEDKHISEKDWENLPFDYIIKNEKMEDFIIECSKIISEIIKRHKYE